MVRITNATYAEYERLGMSSTFGEGERVFFFFLPSPCYVQKSLTLRKIQMVLQRGQDRARVCTRMKPGTSSFTS